MDDVSSQIANGCFSLSIGYSFEGKLIFSVCLPPYGSNLTVVSNDNFVEAPVTKEVSLGEDQINALALLHTKARRVDPNDDVLGLDGSTWDFESNLGSYIAYSVWTPSCDTEKRGLSPLLALGEALAKLSDVEPPW